MLKKLTGALLLGACMLIPVAIQAQMVCNLDVTCPDNTYEGGGVAIQVSSTLSGGTDGGVTIRYIGMLWVPLAFAVIHALRNGDWWRSPGWRFAGWWLLPLGAGMFVAPYHLEEYVTVALPAVCYLSTLGLVALAGPIGRWSNGGCGTISTPSSRWPSPNWSTGFWR